MTTRRHGLPTLALCSVLLATFATPRSLTAQVSHFILMLERGTNALYVFRTATPGTIDGPVPVTGLVAGDTLRAIDVRPANGKLYALGVNAVGTQVRLYTIDQLANATALPPVPGLSSSVSWGMSFNAVTDRIRVVNNNNDNFRLNPDTGGLVGGAVDTALNPASVLVESIAHDNQVRLALSTTLFALDQSVNGWATLGGTGGSPSPNFGQVLPIGPVGVNFGGAASALDIASNGTVYAALRPSGAGGSSLYTINRGTGLANLIGPIGSGILIDSLTIIEFPEAISELYSTPFGTPLVVAAPGVLANDSDPDNSPLQAVIDSTTAAHGVVSLAPDGSFSYTPNPGFSGGDFFEYAAIDGLAFSPPATVLLTVSANQPPTLTPPANQSAIDEGPGVTLGPLSFSVSDPEGAPLSMTASSSDPAIVANAGIALGGSGGSRTVTITSVPGSSGGTTTITLNASDGYATGSATFTVTISPRRGRPIGLTNLSARNTASLQWQAPPISVESVTGYVLEAGMSPGTTFISLPLGATAFSTSAPDGLYYVRVRSQTTGGVSAPSDEVLVALGQAAPPLAPLALLATVQGNTVTLQWTENPLGPTITSYRVVAGSSPGAGDIAQLTLGAGARSLVTGAPSGTYYVRVQAVNAAGAGGPSNEATLLVAPGTCTIPAAPTGLLATVSGGSVTVRWNAPSSGAIPTSYRIEAGRTPGSSDVGVFALPVTTTVSSPIGAGSYVVRLAAVNACGSSAVSPEVSFAVP